MRTILILLLVFMSLNAEDAKQKLTIGAGPYIQTQPYKGASALIVASPVIFFDNSLFYVRWTQFGLYFLGDKQDEYAWAFSLTVQPRPYGYESSDSSYLEGMQTRKNTLEGGVAFSAKHHDTFFETMFLTDLLDRYESWIVKSELGDKFKLGEFTFYPSLICIYQSQKFVNYYYGVESSEVDSSIGREAYLPDGGFQLGAQTYVEYPLTQNLSALLNARVDKLTQDAANSPLTDDDYIYSGLLSLIYTFEY
ncbi:MAG: MipA/OmpV family protein [Campylobacterales bacterium]|nr:MipA/OmpV family protein [Campylobacterales bacterium]